MKHRPDKRKKPPPPFSKMNAAGIPEMKPWWLPHLPKTHPFRWRTTRTKLTFRRSVPIGTAAPPRTRMDFLRNRKMKTGRTRGAPPPPFIFFPRSLLLLDLRVALEPRHGPFHDQTQLAKSQAPPPSSQQTAAPHKEGFTGNENTPKTGKQASSPFRFFQIVPQMASSRVLGPHKRTHHRPVQFQIQDHHKPKNRKHLLLSFRRPRPHTHLQQLESSAVVAIPSISPSRLPAHINVNVISFTSFTSNSCLHKLHSS